MTGEKKLVYSRKVCFSTSEVPTVRNLLPVVAVLVTFSPAPADTGKGDGPADITLQRLMEDTAFTLKDTLVRVEGKVKKGSYRDQKDGGCVFELEDGKHTIRVNCYDDKYDLKDGDEVVVTGRARTAKGENRWGCLSLNKEDKERGVIKKEKGK